MIDLKLNIGFEKMKVKLVSNDYPYFASSAFSHCDKYGACQIRSASISLRLRNHILIVSRRRVLSLQSRILADTHLRKRDKNRQQTTTHFALHCGAKPQGQGHTLSKQVFAWILE